MSFSRKVLKGVDPLFICCSNNFSLKDAFKKCVSLKFLHEGKVVSSKQAISKGSAGYHNVRNVSEGEKGSEGNLKKSKDDERSEDKGEDLKTIEFKNWKERAPSWITRDQDDKQLLKHIEVLQRFSERCKATQGNSGSENVHGQTVSKAAKEKGKTSDADAGDKVKRENYGTFLDAMAKIKDSVEQNASVSSKKMEKKTLNPIENRSALSNTNEKRTFLTLANEPVAMVPTRRITTRVNKRPIIGLAELNPDAMEIQTIFSKTSKPKLYSIVNPSQKKKEFEEYMKKLPPEDRKLSKEDPTPENSTIGEYFTDKYADEKNTKVPKTRKDNFNKMIEESLIEGRRIKGTEVGKVTTELKPKIYAKTTLQVKPTHLPLQLCKNMKSKAKQSTITKPDPLGEKHEQTASATEEDPMNLKNDNLFTRLIKYFKNN